MFVFVMKYLNFSIDKHDKIVYIMPQEIRSVKVLKMSSIEMQLKD